MQSFSPMTTLSAAEIEKIQTATEHLIATTGFVVEHDELLRKARAAGAQVDDASGRVRLPSPLFRELLARVPQHYRISGIGGGSWEIGGDAQHGLAIVTDPWIIDYLTQRPRRPSLEDVRRHTIIGQRLEGVVGMSRMDFPVTDFEDETSSLRALETHLLHHAKHYMVLAATLDNLKQWTHILLLLSRGGPVRELMTVGVAVVSPLTLNRLNCEFLELAAREGFAITPTICPMAGSTAPYSIAGTLLQANIEALMVAVMAQLVRPGTPFLYHIGVSVTDMRSGHDLYYSLDKVLWKLAISQLGRAYGVPTAAECGGTLTHRYDSQSGAEGMLFMLAAHASRAHLLCGFGSNHNANGMSAEMMVIQEAWWKAARFLSRGIRIDDRRLAVENIQSVGPRGNFLTDDLTLELLHEDEFFQNEVFDFSGGYHEGRSMLARAHDRVEQLVSAYESPVPDEVQEGLRRYFHDAYASMGAPAAR